MNERRCQIQWVNEAGESTKDENPAIGRVMWPAHCGTVDGSIGEIQVDDSPWFLICAEHAARLADPELAHWVFESFATES